jgi:hypothetical protein
MLICSCITARRPRRDRTRRRTQRPDDGRRKRRVALLDRALRRYADCHWGVHHIRRDQDNTQQAHARSGHPESQILLPTQGSSRAAHDADCVFSLRRTLTEPLHPPGFNGSKAATTFLTQDAWLFDSVGQVGLESHTAIAAPLLAPNESACALLMPLGVRSVCGK